MSILLPDCPWEDRQQVCEIIKNNKIQKKISDSPNTCADNGSPNSWDSDVWMNACNPNPLDRSAAYPARRHTAVTIGLLSQVFTLHPICIYPTVFFIQLNTWPMRLSRRFPTTVNACLTKPAGTESGNPERSICEWSISETDNDSQLETRLAK